MFSARLWVNTSSASPAPRIISRSKEPIISSARAESGVRWPEQTKSFPGPLLQKRSPRYFREDSIALLEEKNQEVISANKSESSEFSSKSHFPMMSSLCFNLALQKMKKHFEQYHKHFYRSYSILYVVSSNKTMIKIRYIIVFRFIFGLMKN